MIFSIQQQHRIWAFLATSEARLKIDGEKALRWDGVSFFFSGLGTVGKQPSNYVGDKQITSNIESNANTFKLYEAWVQHALIDASSSVLFGLHDLNTEFYVSDTAGLFLNGSFGVGKDLSQSGVNGPSIFPSTALALRLKTENANHLYTQFGVFEAHAGDVDKPFGTQIRLRDADGTLLIGEYGWSRPEGENKKGAAKLAFGAWGYTRTFDHLTDTQLDSNGDSVAVQAVNHGIYFLSDFAFADRWRSFFRYGKAASSVNEFESCLTIGVVRSAPWGDRADDQLGLGFTRITNGAEYLRSVGDDSSATQAETTLELTYKAQVTKGLVLQPDFQYVIDPSTQKSTGNARVMALRMQLDF